MGTAYIRLKFTPVVKYFSQAKSNSCWLEIMPTVSCIENLDKIEWSRQKDSVEYIVPMNYKIIIKKQEPQHQLRVYYSCIDLISVESSPDLSAGDVYRHISDNFILSKANNENFEKKPDLGLKINSRKNDIKAPIKVDDVAYLSISKVKLTEKENIQVTNTRNEYNEYKSIENDINLQEKQPVKKIKIVKTNSNETNYAVSHINADNKNKENFQKQLHITKLCKINTKDISLCNKYVNTDFITIPCFKPSVNRIGRNYVQTKDMEYMENIYTPFCDTLFNCFERVEPEIRIAQFVEKMEKEVFPLKVLLNDLLCKCATLKLNNFMPTEVSGVQTYMSLKNKCYKTCDVQKEMQPNRVVYSIVFDS